MSFTLDRGETLALVGESGSGKSLTALSLLQLLPRGRGNPTGRIVLDGQSVIGATTGTLRRLRGGLAGMVFQEPMTSLNPLHRIGRQVAEAITLHRRLPPRGAAGAGGRACWTRPASPTPRTGWMRSRTSCPAASGSAS